MTTTTFSVQHLDCAACALTMEGICEDTPGVKKAEVRIAKKQLVIEHDESVNPEQLRAVLDKAGYPVDS